MFGNDKSSPNSCQFRELIAISIAAIETEVLYSMNQILLIVLSVKPTNILRLQKPKLLRHFSHSNIRYFSCYHQRIRLGRSNVLQNISNDGSNGDYPEAKTFSFLNSLWSQSKIITINILKIFFLLLAAIGNPWNVEKVFEKNQNNSRILHFPFSSLWFILFY